MDDPTLAVLARALDWACERNAPLILASTTGVTAEKMLDLIGSQTIRLIVVTHEGPGSPVAWRFNPAVREKLAQRGAIVLPDKKAFLTRMAVWFSKTFGVRTLTRRQAILEELLGVGGWVCLKLVKRALRKNLVRAGEVVVAAAGRVSGADTALALRITRTRPLAIALLEVIAVPQPSDSLSL